MKTKNLNLIGALLLSALLSTGCNESTSKKENEPLNKIETDTIAATPKPEDMKKIIRAEVFIKDGKSDEFIKATKELIEKSRAEEGNISYTLYQDVSDKNKFIFFEEWKNQAAIDFHFVTDHFKAFGPTSKELQSSPSVITIYDIASQK